MADKSKAVYHSGIPGADSERPTKSKAEAEEMRNKYEAKALSERGKKFASLPRNDGTFKLTLDEALKKTAK